ncbi:MAG: ABC transporter ATP-binding protein [Oscillospiraceae bacterium]|jgi:ABC-2 type transport system ATP-binding protein|nr:ABC transporter ATP-binding protein [Oscillospiraceae bacterium]
MSEPAILVEDVSMCFKLHAKKVDNLKEYFIRRAKRDLTKGEFWALKHVSFRVEKGERLGVLGFNGAGKSTVLKIIAGVMRPTEGRVHVDGVIAPLLELGAGFDQSYSGRENVYLYGATMGFPRKYLRERYDSIVEFAELQEKMEQPVKNYSSGQRARLGFAIATAVEPDVLIADEVLSVGDARFKAKCEKRIMGDMVARGVTVLLVSHSTEQVRRLCTKAILLDKGELIAAGTADEVCAVYDKMVKKK